MDFEQIIDRLYPRFIEYGKTREEVANAVRKMNYMQDTVFKSIFASPDEDSNKLRLYIAESVLKRKVIQVEIRNSEFPEDGFLGKRVFVDLLCEVEEKNGKHSFINIEVQNYDNEEGILRKAYYYGARIISSQIKKGMALNELKPTIILMVTKKQFEGKEAVHTFGMYDSVLGYEPEQLLQFIYLETEKNRLQAVTKAK